VPAIADARGGRAAASGEIAETVACGRELDSFSYDRHDTVATDCEGRTKH